MYLECKKEMLDLVGSSHSDRARRRQGVGSDSPEMLVRVPHETHTVKGQAAEKMRMLYTYDFPVMSCGAGARCWT